MTKIWIFLSSFNFSRFATLRTKLISKLEKQLMLNLEIYPTQPPVAGYYYYENCHIHVSYFYSDLTM